MSDCPCSANKSYESCCKPYHLNQLKPASPEKLMRSRFSAYALHLIDYLIQTTFPSERHLHSRLEIENWAKSNIWLKLEICEVKKEIVEFKAFYQNGLNKYIHHERSVFKKIGQDWYYLRGTYPQ